MPQTWGSQLTTSLRLEFPAKTKRAIVIWLGGMPAEELLNASAAKAPTEDIDFSNLAAGSADPVSNVSKPAPVGPGNAPDMFEERAAQLLVDTAHSRNTIDDKSQVKRKALSSKVAKKVF